MSRRVPHALSLLAALLLACTAPAACRDLPGTGLSPPWWVTYDLFEAALRPDPCLNVSSLEVAAADPDAAYVFNITACFHASPEKLAGLATLLTVRYNFGGTRFASRVLDHTGALLHPAAPKDAEHALRMAGAALQGNAYFVSTAVSRPLPCLKLHWVVCEPAVVQVWIDNLADLWGNINLLAADLLDRVYGLERFGVRATTMKFQDGAQQQRQHQQGGAQRLVLPSLAGDAAAAGAGRRQLAAAGQAQGSASSSSSSSSSMPGSWQVQAQCWALRLARRLGGEAAERSLLPWVLR